MKVSNNDIFNGKEALAELMQQKLPVRTSYWVTKLARKVSEHLRDIETVRRQLITQYGTKDDETGNVTVKPDGEQWEAFATAYNELMNETADIEGIEKITLPTDNGLCVTPAHLMALEAFVEVE